MASISHNNDFGMQALQTLFDNGHGLLLAESKDDYYRTPLRLACDLGLEIEFVRLLVNAVNGVENEDTRNEIIMSCDRIKKWNLLHAICALSNKVRREEFLQEILHHQGFKELVNVPDGEYQRTCFHILVKTTGIYSETDPSLVLLLNAGADRSLKDKLDKTASDYQREFPATQKRNRRGKTLIYSHDLCFQHYTAPPDDTAKAYYSKKDIPPENVNRLVVLLNERFGTIRSRKIRDLVQYEMNPPKAEFVDILRVHEWPYVQSFMKKCEALDDDCLGDMDGDTTFSSKTFDASLVACGAAIAAIDEVVLGSCENAENINHDCK